MTLLDMDQRSYLTMRMMKLEKLARFIMMMLRLRGTLMKLLFSILDVIFSHQILSFGRLLNRDQIEGDGSSVDDEEDDDFLKAFKVAFLHN